MKATVQTANDNFRNDSVQLNIVGPEEERALKINPEKYSGIYRELAEILGDAATVKIWRRFSGLNITFPQKLYSKEFRKDYIKENMEEMKPGEMAKVLGVSERRIRQIIMEIRDDE